MKMKEIGPGGVPGAPLDPPMEFIIGALIMLIMRVKPKFKILVGIFFLILAKTKIGCRRYVLPYRPNCFNCLRFF